MSGSWATPGVWLAHSAAGGGLLLLLTWALVRWTKQPARRQRLGECGLAAALVLAVLSLAPPWLRLDLPAAAAAPAPDLHAAEGKPCVPVSLLLELQGEREEPGDLGPVPDDQVLGFLPPGLLDGPAPEPPPGPA